MAENVIDFTDATFDSEVLNGEGLVLVDFWAPWCGPCKLLAPTIAEIAAENAGKVKVGKLNTADNNATAASQQVQGLPLIRFFKDGQPVESMMGVQAKARLQDAIDRHLA